MTQGGHSEGAMGRLVAEMYVWKLHQSQEIKTEREGKPWEDEWQR